MIKIILNNDTAHPILTREMNYSSTLKVDDYSSHHDSIIFNIEVQSINNISLFENVEITSLKLIKVETEEEIVNLTFTDDVYIISYNATIFDGGANTHMTIAKVDKQA